MSKKALFSREELSFGYHTTHVFNTCPHNNRRMTPQS